MTTPGALGALSDRPPTRPKESQESVGKCPNCPSTVAGAVHDLLADNIGDAKAWQDDPATVRWFVASEAPAALERHGYRFETFPHGWCLLARIKQPATPADLFARMYVADPASWVAVADVRGHWLAEHVSLPMNRRDDGIAVLLAMGGRRGRVKGVGGVIRGVRLLEPIEEAFA